MERAIALGSFRVRSPLAPVASENLRKFRKSFEKFSSYMPETIAR